MSRHVRYAVDNTNGDTTHNWETENRRKTALHERTQRDKRDTRRSAKDAAQKALA